jgi:hypothetical protein
MSSIPVDAQRVVLFLEANQLVQAHGVLSKLITSMHSLIATEAAADASIAPPPAGLVAEEAHPLWHHFREAYRIKTLILAGNTKEALARAQSMRMACFAHARNRPGSAS